MGEEAAWPEDDGRALDDRWQPGLSGDDGGFPGLGPDGEAPASLESLDQIINCIADPIFVKDRRHRLVLVNDAECMLAGRTREELLGRTDRDILPGRLRDNRRRRQGGHRPRHGCQRQRPASGESRASLRSHLLRCLGQTWGEIPGSASSVTATRAILRR